MYLDEEEVGKITADKLLKIPLSEGEYMLRFESAENPADYIAGEFNMPDKDKVYSVDLLSKKQEREKKELKEKEQRKQEERELFEGERSEKEEKERKEREERGEFEVNGVKFKMVRVEGGTFTMGATAEQKSDAFSNEELHEVTLGNYYIGETQVTQALWKAVMGKTPSKFKGDECLPVESVSWNDIVEKFIPELNKQTGRTFRLPTEAEWEFAARGGVKSKRYKYSGSNNIDEVAWYGGNSGDTHPVKMKKANELGLYDMSGNVWEWCNDWYGAYSIGVQTNPSGPDKGSGRVLRGGSWNSRVWDCRVSRRFYSPPGSSGYFLGLRLVLCP